MDEIEVPLYADEDGTSVKDRSDGGKPAKHQRNRLHYTGGNILPDHAELRNRLESIGIASTDRVLAYVPHPGPGGDVHLNLPLAATRFLWALAYCGVRRVGLIDGGLVEWNHCGFPVDRQWAARPPTCRPFFASSNTTESTIEGTIDERSHDDRSSAFPAQPELL